MHRGQVALVVGTAVHAMLSAATAATWVGGNGNWSATNPPAAAGWSPTVPNAIGAVADKTSASAVTTTQDIGAGVTVGRISQGGSSNVAWSITNTNGITLNEDGAGAGFATLENVNSSTGNANGLVISGGTLTLADNLLIRNTSGSTRGAGAIAIFSALAGSNSVTVENSGSGAVYLRGASPTFSGDLVLKSGHLAVLDNASAGGTGAIQFGDTTGSAGVRLSGGMGMTNAINVVYGSTGTRAIGTVGGGTATSIASTITLGGNSVAQSVDLTLNPGAATAGFTSHTGSFTLAGNVVGYGGVIITNTATGGTQLISAGINSVGSIANTGSTRATTISGTIGSNVTGLTQGSTGGALTLSGNNTFAGTTTLAVAGTLNIGHSNALHNSTLNKTDGTIVFLSGITSATFGGLAGTSGFALTNAGSAAVALSAGQNDSSNSFSGALTGGGSFVKVGTGTQTLAGSDTYSGVTTVSAGTLLVNGTHTGAGAYSVNSGGTLGGEGTITTAGNASVTLNAGGKLAPGASPGTLTLSLGTGSLNISPAAAGTGSLVYELGAPASSDQILLSAGTLNIGSGVLNFDDFVFTVTGPLAETTYTLIDTSGAISGTLGLNLSGNIGPSHTGVLSLGDGGNDLVLTISAVPEPAALSIVGLAAAGLLRRRR